MPAVNRKVSPSGGSEARMHRKSNASMTYDDIEDESLSEVAEEEGKESDWIHRHILKRQCCKYVPKPEQKNKELLCHCNFPKSAHNKSAQQNFRPGDTEWKANQHTETLPTDAFGDIEFLGYGQKIGKFVRVDHQTDMDIMLALLMDVWELQQPNLLISVTGGAKNFHMRPRLKEMFNRGLMKAAASTGAWIVTGGMHAGVMKHVGEAVRDHIIAHGTKAKVTAIAIAPWGAVTNKEYLIDSKGSWPAHYRLDLEKKGRQSPIDPNHSHFILVDNGTQHMFATEILFRAQLESAIAKMKTNTGEGAVAVPVVCVVLEGGPGTLETVKSAIQNGIPAVIVEGSGRAADILAYAYNNSREEEVEVTDQLGQKHKRTVTIVDDEVWQEVTRLIEAEWGDRDLSRRVSWVKDCFQRRDYITIFQMDGKNSAKDIDIAILQALLKVNKDQSVDQLRLALAWNRIDVAKSDIFFEDKKWKPGELDDALYTAICNNRVDFVKLFLENGVALRDFLTIKRLLLIYNSVPKNSLLYQMLAKEGGRCKYFSLDHVGKVIQDLMGDFYKPLYLSVPEYREVDPDKLFSAVSRSPSLDSIAKEVDTSQNVAEVGGYSQKMAKVVLIDATSGEEIHMPSGFVSPQRELFIFSVLMNYMDMATVFWDEGKEGIAAALVAQRLLKSMKSKTDDSELERELSANASHFENLAVGVLSESYSVDEKKAGLLLVRELPLFGNSTVILLAVEADNKAFIAHAACQALLNNIWRGRMTHDIGWLRILSCIICPPLIYLLIKYREDDRLRLVDDTARNLPKKKPKREKIKLGRQKTLPMIEMTPDIKRGSREKLVVAEPEEKQQSYDMDKKSSQSSRRKITCLQRLTFFYNAPVITFIHSCISYVAFLILFSIILLSDFHRQPSVAEYILIAWVFTLFAEELRQVFSDESSSLYLKLRSYISDVWNILDVLALFLFLLGLILRFIPEDTCSNCFDAARIILALNLMTFFFRILHIFSVHKELGPKLVMIGQMMIDLVFFIIILLVFIVAYGLAAHIILFPNSELNLTLISDVLRRPYFQIYGELFLEELEVQASDGTCTENPLLWKNDTLPRCPANTWVVPVLLGVYILITNVLMLNLLIAMFSYTFANVQENTHQHYQYLRLQLIKEYYERPSLAPPLIIFGHIWRLGHWILEYHGCVAPQDSSFKMTFTDQEEKQLVVWENMNADEYLRRTQAEERESLNQKVNATSDRVDVIMTKVDELAESNFMLNSQQAGVSQPKLPPVLDERLNYLEDQMKRTAKALDWIILSMTESGAGTKKGPPRLVNVDEMKEEARKRKDQIAQREKEQFQAMLMRQLELHVKSRTAQYPCDNKVVYRYNVPDDKVPWEVEFPEYDPTTHTDQDILDMPSYADIDLLQIPADKRPKLPYNKMDKEKHVDRISHLGPYQVVDGLPLNPRGRTGLCGRGMLGRWGPNHAGDPVVTRWKHDESGNVAMEGGKRVLEFVAIQRPDSREWAIPGSILKPGCEAYSCLKAEFSEEAVGSLLEEKDMKEVVQAKLDKLFKNHGQEVYKGYADDHRNTDNAWIETIAINYHDDEGSILRHFILRAGDQVEVVRWQTLSGKQPLYGVHLQILQKVAQKHNAAF